MKNITSGFEGRGVYTGQLGFMLKKQSNEINNYLCGYGTV